MTRFLAASSMLAFLFVVNAIKADGWLDSLGKAGTGVNGFAEYRYGRFTQDDDIGKDVSLNEMRLQLDAVKYADAYTLRIKTDLIYDDAADDRDNIDLETGEGYIDLREANLLLMPLRWVDLKIGRQVLTWGTGDLIFINDLFPKDWQSFFLGRDEEYLKAPSDSVFLSMFPSFANIDIAYTPRFDADRYISGKRISYWNGHAISDLGSEVEAEMPEEWFTDDEIAARIYRRFGSYETAFYLYNGFWKSPGGRNPDGTVIFPELRVYGASLLGPVPGGIGKAEAGYYECVDDLSGDDPLINNSEARILVGYEREAFRNFTIAAQYYVEHMMEHDKYRQALIDSSISLDLAGEEDRHTVTLRLTWLLMNQNLTLDCFTRYSPSDRDVYVKPTATYKMSDNWQVSLGGNFFAGDHEHTFLGQFENSSNLNASLRCSF